MAEGNSDTKNIVWLNGTFMPLEKASISPHDRGFRYGDGVFDTMAVRAGVPLAWDFHINRLHEGLEAIHISPGTFDWHTICRTLLERNTLAEGFLRIAVSRGVGGRGYHPPTQPSPTIFIETLQRPVTPHEPARLWLSQTRKPAPHTLPTQHKLAHGLNSTLALLEATSHGCDEALLLAQDGTLCEAASGNLFWLENDTLLTPALSTGCLNGSTRHILMQLADTVQVHAKPDRLNYAHGVFMTNCNWGLWPVRSLSPNGWQWGSSDAITQLQRTYEQWIDEHIHTHRADWS